MKNTFLILVFLGFILSSCATTNRYASNTFEDAIYQSPGSGPTIVVNTDIEKEVEALRGKTRESNRVIIDGRVIEGVYADEYGNVDVDIDADSDKTYIILNPGETFEERLAKFENPTYTININYDYWNFSNPWYWDIYYNPYNRYWRRQWYAGWSPYHWNYMYPSWDYYWFSPFTHYDPFLWGYPYNSPYMGYNPWYFHNPYHSWGNGWYSPGYAHNGGNYRDRYYGRRESPREQYSQSGRGASSEGSFIRRDVRTSQVRGSSVTNDPNELTKRYSESIYRRDSRSSNTSDPRINETGQASRRGAITRTSSSATQHNSSGGNVTRRESSSTETMRQSTGTTRQSTGTVRQSTGTTRQSTGTVRQSTGRTRQPYSSNSRSNIYSTQYRQPARTTSTVTNTTQRSSGNNTGNTSYQRNTSAPTRSYNPPPASSSSSGSTSRSAETSSSSRSSSSSSGSGYRR